MIPGQKIAIRPVVMSKRVKMAIDNLRGNRDFDIVLGFWLQCAGVHSPQESYEDLIVQQFGLKMMGSMDLYTTNGDFPLRHAQSCNALPRSKGWNVVEIPQEGEEL